MIEETRKSILFELECKSMEQENIRENIKTLRSLYITAMNVGEIELLDVTREKLKENLDRLDLDRKLKDIISIDK